MWLTKKQTKQNSTIIYTDASTPQNSPSSSVTGRPCLLFDNRLDFQTAINLINERTGLTNMLLKLCLVSHEVHMMCITVSKSKRHRKHAIAGTSCTRDFWQTGSVSTAALSKLSSSSGPLTSFLWHVTNFQMSCKGGGGCHLTSHFQISRDPLPSWHVQHYIGRPNFLKCRTTGAGVSEGLDVSWRHISPTGYMACR